MPHAISFQHPSLEVVDISGKGRGFVASGGDIAKGELLLEEFPFAWSGGRDLQQLDINPGVNWLLQTGAVRSLSAGTAAADATTPRERAQAAVMSNAFRSQVPDKDGRFTMYLFRATSLFNHACFANAGASYASWLSDTSANDSVSPLRTFAIEDVHQGEEVCICYLPVELQLSPAAIRRDALKSWGFHCQCKRCSNTQISIDAKVYGTSFQPRPGIPPVAQDIERRRLTAPADRDSRAMFDPSFEGYDWDKLDLMSAVARLLQFRERYGKLLNPAHIHMQRVRRELLAVFLQDLPLGKLGCSGPSEASDLLLEEIRVQHEILPALSPCKVGACKNLLRIFARERPSEDVSAVLRDAGTWHLASLWLHDSEGARLVGAPKPTP